MYYKVYNFQIHHSDMEYHFLINGILNNYYNADCLAIFTDGPAQLQA